MATKKVETFDLQLVTYSTPLPVDVVIARLDAEVVKDKCPGKEFGAGEGFKTKEEVEAALTAGIGPSGLIYFTEFDHGKWLPFYQDPPFSKPARRVLFYHIGNPIIAETMIRHDIRASHNLPPRVLIVEREDGSGTDVHFHLPSSVIYLNRPHTEMKAATDRLDRIFEGIGERITAV
ncbi:hypothetical protein FB45DRAFT_1056589 [Roridomyces roridus]|uniref:DUF302 domain-containing protein n=1 Tax=Roridomyces roridus TaxID=1738132 RepID=A0AAD7FNS2_9AGAR|nr:hypothetical protein FB45DRAFT_1056589 [Roridomyces roridus]